MKHRRKLWGFILYSMLLICIAGLNEKFDLVLVPVKNELIDRQIDFITISTVFAGFSFTTLGLLLGLSSEKLIELIKNTDIMIKKVSRIIQSIIFFIASVTVSLILILGIEYKVFLEPEKLKRVEEFLYVMNIGYLIGGIGLFVFSVYELYDLVKRIYQYNNVQRKKEINEIKEDLKKLGNREENSIFED